MDEVVSKIVPDTQPISPQHPKFFYRSKLRSSMSAVRRFARQTSGRMWVATSTISTAWPELSEFESQAGVARPEAVGVGFRRHDRFLNPTFDRSLLFIV
jgi:hypothetical protein